MGPRAGLKGFGYLAPMEIRSPDRPARSESLYRLGYPGPFGADTIHKAPNYTTFSNFMLLDPDRLCSLVVRVSGYRYRGPGFDSRRYQIF